MFFTLHENGPGHCVYCYQGWRKWIFLTPGDRYQKEGSQFLPKNGGGSDSGRRCEVKGGFNCKMSVTGCLQIVKVKI